MLPTEKNTRQSHGPLATSTSTSATMPVHTASVERADGHVRKSPDDHAGPTVNDRRDSPPTRRQADVGDAALQERITKLEARLADGAPTADAHVNALYGGMRALVAELIRRRRQAERTCETLTQVLEATSDGFVALDGDWRYTYVNAHAGRMFNRDPQSLIGKHIWTEFPEGVGHPFHQAYERAVREGVPTQVEEY